MNQFKTFRWTVIALAWVIIISMSSCVFVPDKRTTMIVIEKAYSINPSEYGLWRYTCSCSYCFMVGKIDILSDEDWNLGDTIYLTTSNPVKQSTTQ